MYHKVVDEPNLVRDSNSKAILNVNNLELNKYKREKEEKLKIKKAVEGYETLKEELKSTKNDLSEIKKMLIQLMEKQ
jgi:hypothetical protein